MVWQKGKKRGTSPLRGRHTLDLDPTRIKEILDDAVAPPEDRFVAVMDMLLEAMMGSTNKNVETTGTALHAFWEDDMSKTIIWTPLPGEKVDEY